MENNTPNYQESPAPNNYEPETGRYKKKSLWKWILLYVILGAIAYGLIYYYFLSSTTSYTPPKTVKTSPTVSEENLKPVAISIINSAFSPATLTIHKGTMITWTNNDSMTHTVTADKNGPISPQLKKGDSYRVPFTKVGTFSYHCSIHPNMKGVITIIE